MKRNERTGEKGIENILKIFLGMMFVAVLLFFVLGECLLPTEDPTQRGEATLFETEWNRVFPDGSREAVEVPGQCEALSGEIVRLETYLPENLADTWLCMRASQQDMRVYVEEELRQEYDTEKTRLFGIDSASAFVFFEVNREDAGKVLSIEIVSECEYAGFLNSVYIGDKSDIITLLIKECGVVIFVSLYMLVLSSLTVLVGCILKLVHKKRIDIIHLGLGIMQLSLAMTAESRIRQFFLPNLSVASYVGFLLTILIPYPFMVYVNGIQKERYQKIYTVLSSCVVANFIISVVLQLCGVLELSESMVVSYILIVAMVLVFAVTIGLDIKNGKIREYGEVIVGLIAMIVVSLWETYITFFPQTPQHGGVALSFGLIILLFMAGVKTAREMMDVEKERQVAIAASEAKAKFLANMSHEIRTPINTILGMNEMILRENQDKTIGEYAMNVQSAGKLLLGLVNDVLDFSKIEAGKMELVEGEYHPAEMFHDVIVNMRIRADAKQLKLVTDIEPALPDTLAGDELRIRQILVNLLTNAVKYTKEGTITFSAKVIHREDAFWLSIAVEDTGIGMKKEDVARLFDSFQRFEENQNRYIEGTGLGLDITRQLVILMGGTIEVESEYGKGSCFTVELPQKIISKKSELTENDEMNVKAASVNSLKTQLEAPDANILVVDDNDMNLAVVRALLKRTKINLALAHSGNECLELCRKKEYDLILMDHMMPPPDGIETLHMLRQDAEGLNKDTDVIVLTANAIAGMEEMYLEEGFKGYLSKPVAADKLEEMIHRHLPKDKIKGWQEEETYSADMMPVIDKQVGLLYCADSEDMYYEMLDSYDKQGEEYVEKLSVYFEAGDWKNYKIAVHALKSTSLLIGAAEFSEKAARLEQAAGNNREDVLLAEGKDFLEEYKKILKRVKELKE